MVDCLDCLRHHGVIRCDDDDRKVGELGTAGTHGREGLVARSVEEGDPSSVRKLDIVGSDVLGDTSGFTGDDIGFADVVQEGGLAVVDVAHHGDHRRTRNEILFPVFLGVELLGEFGSHELDLVAELFRHENQRLGIESLVDRNHQAKIHAGLDDFVDRSVVHEGRQVVHGHEFSDLEHLLLCHHILYFLLALGCCKFSPFLPVLGSEVALLVVVHPCVGLLDLLLDFLLHCLLLLFGHHRLELVGSALTLLAALALVLGGFAGTGFATIALLLAGSAVVGILAFLGDIDLLGAL